MPHSLQSGVEQTHRRNIRVELSMYNSKVTSTGVSHQCEALNRARVLVHALVRALHPCDSAFFTHI